MSKPIQQNRQIAITTALGEDALVLNRATIHERFSASFTIEAELSAEDGNVDYKKVVGHPACIRLELGQHGTRYFHGYVSRFLQATNQGGYARYRATIVPWTWFLTRTSDCRVFQRKKVRDIAEDVFNGHRFGSEFYEFRLRDTYPSRRYCVQYRETDLNFVSRLFESEGIYYWFEHKQDRHRLVLADSVQASQPRAGYEALEYHEVETPGAEGREVITEWIVEQEVEPVSYALKDFDFKKPNDPLLATQEVKREHGMARFAMYDYPGEYFEPAEAERYARLRLEEVQAGHEVVQVSTTARGLAVGQVCELQKHPRDDQNSKYLITDLTLTLDAGEFASGGTGDEFLQCSFRAIRSTTPYRPPRATPKPVIQGIQTATVVGPAGEEIFTDEHARVKVRFHWDRNDKISDEDRTCFIRVSQANAGKGWGSMITPRIGQEVIVEFLEGDPDRPIITGRVYNEELKPPYAGGNGVVSGLKSQTHKGSGFNEMSMDDTAGKEKITIHGQYDMNTTIEHDETHTVKTGDRTIKVVAGKHTETIKGDTTIKIESGKLSHEVAANTADYKVEGALTEKYNTSQTTDVKGKIAITSAEADIYIHGCTSIQLHVGTSKLWMASDGRIELSGANIVIKGSESVTVQGKAITSEAETDHNISGNILVTSGKTTNTVKGGMVMLNPGG